MHKNHLIFEIACLIFIATLLGACASPTPPPTQPPLQPTNTVPPPTSLPTVPGPSPRAGAALAYDSKTNQVLMFGGTDGTPCWDDCPPMFGDTWIFDIAASAWSQIKPPAAPTPRASAALAYDAESDRIILFSGFESGKNYALQDTWAFDMNAKTWTQMKSQGPPYHFGCSLVYDSKADRMIMWGGWNMEKYVGLDDTWTYDYNTDTWTEMKPAVKPPGVNLQSMDYDSKADRVVMWGGGSNTSVWIYDLNADNWEERKPSAGPSSRFLHKMTYDPKADQIVLYGGYTGDPNAAMDYDKYTNSETWLYDYNTNTWKQQNPSVNPGPLAEFGQVYILSLQRVLLFGGTNANKSFSNKIWTYDTAANTWAEVQPK